MQEGEEIKRIKITRNAKVLGFKIDAHCNNLEHIKYVEQKTQKAQKMLG